MTNPEVSIIIPSYNAAAYVKEAVDSALAQTYKDCEVVVVDDGSTDNTKEILRPYAGAGRIKYVYQTNKGLAGARNTGIKAAAGEYIALLDADDIFLPEKISEQVKALEAHPDFDVCYCDMLHFTDPPASQARASRAGPPEGVNDKRTYYHHRYTYPSGNIFEPLLHRQFINPLSVVARREVFEKYGYFDEALRRSEDWDLWLRWARAGVKFYYLDKPLAHYRMRSVGNLSSIESEPEMKKKNMELFERVGAKMSAAEKKKYDFENIMDGLRFKAAIANLMNGDKNSALQFLERKPFARFAVRIMPAGFWRSVLGSVRRLKHRSLLKKL